ncbi:hypothetical protein [Roseateles puraquae]|jgi:hypothetical protein|uniref:Uncharacterized protein n=1 Tax=Roseateles puraquae TaxID=431059 RepID=A0A254N0X4_9BURK|nr:hypothetical protein [Roseateles puraquae]MDG0856822.1 hypothetical protein [Roseateles puraquae]OWR01926.1 hypothetical protein CDO81_21570 [Roseateles puraquae]
MNFTWLLLIAAAALLVIGALRWDLLVARWRELTGFDRQPAEAPPALDRVPGNPGLRPHAAPVHKPGFHRSGRRH